MLTLRGPVSPARVVATLLAGIALGSCATLQPSAEDLAVISIVGTNDVHGEFMPNGDRGGLVTVAGYVNALRSARAEGAVVLIDAGDMWQGTLESNLSEGAAVVEAYNAMGYAAAAIGNHEFDFGPVGDAAIPQHDTDDARGALRRRATEAHFPFLAANLIDASSGAPVEWDNVAPSVIIEAAGIRVGIIGVLTENALQATIAANTVGLRVAPLAESIRREASKLRAGGAELIVVTAHAGSTCRDFSDPDDLSSCDMNGEIMHVAKALPAGLVDHIIAGHIHQGIAHSVNGIAVTSSYSSARAFSRVDFTIDTATGRVISREVFPPQFACPYRRVQDDSCAWQQDAGSHAASYEGFDVEADDEVLAIAKRAQTFSKDLKQEKIGAYLETPFTLKGNPESALGNLMTDAILETIGGDIAIHNVSGGIRATLPAGKLTFGSVYEVFPFDNHVVVLEMSGRDLRKVIAAQAMKSRRRAGFSGMRVSVRCDDEVMSVEMRRPNGALIEDFESLRVVANDYLALGGDAILTPAMPAGGFSFDSDLPLTRDVLVSWFRGRGSIRADDFLTGDRPKWGGPAELPETCRQLSDR